MEKNTYSSDLENTIDFGNKRPSSNIKKVLCITMIAFVVCIGFVVIISFGHGKKNDALSESSSTETSVVLPDKAENSFVASSSGKENEVDGSGSGSDYVDEIHKSSDTVGSPVASGDAIVKVDKESVKAAVQQIMAQIAQKSVADTKPAKPSNFLYNLLYPNQKFKFEDVTGDIVEDVTGDKVEDVTGDIDALLEEID